jgi:RimJ/RimL family protein N-acetyltransferase
MNITYRTLEKKDAESFWSMMTALDQETKFMLYEPGERSQDLKIPERMIESARENDDFLMAAEADGEIIGFLSAQKGKLRRIKHSAYIITGIREAYQGMGIGTELFSRLNDWAEKTGLERLELTVLCANERARHLYEKKGFVVEGIKKRSVITDGIAMDEYYMGKIIERKSSQHG